MEQDRALQASNGGRQMKRGECFAPMGFGGVHGHGCRGRGSRATAKDWFYDPRS